MMLTSLQWAAFEETGMWGLAMCHNASFMLLGSMAAQLEAAAHDTQKQSVGGNVQ